MKKKITVKNLLKEETTTTTTTILNRIIHAYDI